MRKVVWVLAFGVACALGVAARPPQQAAANRPTWAFLVPDANQPPAEDLTAPKKLPGSSKTYTQAQIDDLSNPPDWFPDSHPPAPPVVSHGNGKDVLACGACHLMSGLGHPESANLAGLSAGYIESTMEDFKTGARKDPARMTAIGKAISEEDIKAAAEWFASLKPMVWTKVVEADMVPKTYVTPTRARLPLPGGGMEPIGNRIIEVPDDAQRAIERDPTSGFTAYVPVGTLAKGKDLVETGGNGVTLQCAICHGDSLQGMGDVPRIAGLSPIYIGRQLYNLQVGQNNGAAAAMMQPVIGKLTDDQMLQIAAYVASLKP
jgi:cytochrome c553